MIPSNESSWPRAPRPSGVECPDLIWGGSEHDTCDATDEFGDLIGDDSEYIHQYDAMASTNALLDATGMVEATYKYYAYGAVAAVAIEGDAWVSLTVDQWADMSVDQWAALPVELTSNMLAGGQKQYYLDFETAMFLLGAGNNGRYYDSATGRFISEDPIRRAGGDENLYRYVENNPVIQLSGFA